MTIKDHAIHLVKFAITVSCAASCTHILFNGWESYLEAAANFILYKKGTLVGILVGSIIGHFLRARYGQEEDDCPF